MKQKKKTAYRFNTHDWPAPSMLSLTQLLIGSVATATAIHLYLPAYSFGLFGTAALLYLVSFLSRGIWQIVIYPKFFSALRDLPTPADNHWFYGQTKKVLASMNGRPMREWAETIPNDGLLKYSVWFRERVLITTPKVLGEVLVTQNYEFIKPSHFRDGLGRILGIGILLAEGDEHKRQRKNLMPAFAFRHIKELYPVFWTKSREMVETLRVAASSTTPPSEKLDNSVQDPEKAAADLPQHAPGVIEVGNYTSRATLDIIGLSGMGRDFDSLRDPSNKLNQTYRKIFNPDKFGRFLQILGIFLPFWFLKHLPIKRNDDLNAASELIKQTCRDLIKGKREALEKGHTDVDILSVALKSGGFTDEDLVNQMMTFLVAGHETTATSMIWSLYLLCRHPEAQQKLRDEVRSKLPSLKEDITAAQIDNCHYLNAVCNEVLRLWSPVTLTMRVAAHDTTLNGHFIPKNTTIILAPWAINTSTQLWGADALDFKPERWLDAEGRMNKNGGADSNYSFLTFLHGPRSCIGQKFAQAEFACLLASWIGTFETTFEEGSPLAEGEPEVKGGITSKPKGGLWVRLREIEGW